MAGKHKLILLMFLMAALAAVVAACGNSGEDQDTTRESTGGQMPGMSMSDVPEDLDTSAEKGSDGGLFRVSVNSSIDPLPLNQIHSWTIHLQSDDGLPVEGAQIEVGGGMPQHNHGFPTEPEVTNELGNGDYLLEGMKFSMSGWWELALNITTGDVSDSVTFNIVLP